MATITGTPDNDRLEGGAEADVINGLAGNDRLDGGEGADTLTGGLGDDVYIVDNVGDLVIEADGEGRDTVTAFADWTLAAGSSVERLVVGGLLALDLTGNDLANQIFGNMAANTLTGGGGDDNLYGRDGDDTLRGNAGDDVLDGGAGADDMAGGLGDDVYFVDNAADTVTEAAGGGIDRVVTSVTWVLDPAAEVERLYSQGTGTIDLTGSSSANTIVANNAANLLLGLGGDDRITARGGNDTLVGGGGDDTLIGGTGADAMSGGTGDDTYYVDNAGDTVTELTGGGTDRVYVDTTWTLGTGQAVEVLIGRGNAAIDITGNELANEIFGNRGANVLLGGGGDDTIHAGAGDTVDGGIGADTYVITGGGTGDIRVFGGAGDTLSTSDTGWIAMGTAMLDGTLVNRFQHNGITLVVDAGVDTSGVITAPMFGTASGGRQVINLDQLSPARGFAILGDALDDQAGVSVSSAGDVNGDGFIDLILGANQSNDGGTYAGKAYVLLGSAEGFGTEIGGRRVIDLASLSAAQGFAIQGDAAGDSAGRDVSSIGDLNGDGYDDLIVGAPGGDDGGSDAGEAYVIFGRAGTFGTDIGGRQVIDLSTLAAADGFIIQGDASGDLAGFRVSSAGDVNGDGFADLIIGAWSGSDGGNDSGEAYVLFGGAGGFGVPVAGRQVVDLSTLTAGQGFLIQADAAYDRNSYSVASAGDINGDGFDDLIVGAPNGDDAANLAGEAYVVFGRAGGFGTSVGGRQVMDLTTLSAAEGFIIQGSLNRAYTGTSVSSAGDVNGDGFADLLVAAPAGYGSNAAEAYVVFGGADGFGVDVAGRQVVSVLTLSQADGFIIRGDASGGSLRAVSPAGDVNGDGFDDLIVGAPFNSNGANQAGEAYVVFGKADGFGDAVENGGITRQVINLSTLEADEGFVVRGSTAREQVGFDLAQAGDVNGDGFADLFIGAQGDLSADPDHGPHVLYGGPAGFTLAQVAGATDGNDLLVGTGAAERLVGGRGDDMLIGGGGADVFVGGQGDDVIDVGSGSFFRIDGGTGNDTLVTTGNLDFTLLDDVMIKGVEIIDVTGNGAQTLTMDLLDVLALQAANTDMLGTTDDNVVIVRGDAGDTLNLSGFGAASAGLVFEGIAYELYAVNGKVMLAVASDIMVV